MPKKHKPHPVAKIVIKSANIDKVMVPLVNWLNSFESVHTLFCCQENNGGRPYVSWTCTDTIELIYILEFLGYTANNEIIWNKDKRHIEYVTRFDSRNNLNFCLEGIKFTKKPSSLPLAKYFLNRKH